MSRILIVSAVFPPEPVVSATLSEDLAAELSKDHEVTVLCPQPTRPQGFVFEREFSSPLYKIHRINSYTNAASSFSGRLYESFSFGKHCAQYIDRHSTEYDCIYLNVWPLFAPFLIVKAARKCHIPCINHVQDVYPESLTSKLKIGKKLICNLLMPLDRFVARKSAALVTISEAMKQAIVQSRNINAEKVSVVLNWQNEESFVRFKEDNPQPDTVGKPFTFMYLGNNGPLANVELLIEAFFAADIKKSRLIVAGSGSQKRACEELTKSLKAENVEFIPVPEGKVPEIQDVADVMLLPVKKHGAMSSIPSKLPAYMFSSKPIIGSLDFESDTALAILESGCGVVVAPDNLQVLKAAMIKMANTDSKTLDEMGKMGFEYALKHFSKLSNLEKLSRLIVSFTK